MNHVYGPIKYVDRWFAVHPWIACVAGGISVGVLFWRRSREKSAYKSPSRQIREGLLYAH